jgi:cytochrome P450
MRSLFAQISIVFAFRWVYFASCKRNTEMNTTHVIQPSLPNFGSTTDCNPYPYYEALRGKAALVWEEEAQAWLVTGYEECRQIETDENRFRHPYADADQTLIDIKGGRRNVTVLQKTEHAAMHKFLLRLFSPTSIAQYRTEHVIPVIGFLLDRIAQAGKAELVSAVCAQLPPRVLMSLFAMDGRDDGLVQHILDLHDSVLNWVGQRNRGVELTLKAQVAAQELNALLAPYLADRKARLGTDLISRVWLEGPQALDDFTDADALATTRELFLAGTDTTIHAISNSLYILLTQPAVMERVRSERGQALATFVEESLRIYGAVQYRFRIANEHTQIGGVAVNKNDALILINAAANRDPARFECPEQVNLDRRNARSHLAFNAGPRTCIGAALARAEMIDLLNALFDRTRNLRLDPDAEAPSFRYHYIRSFRPLNVLFDPA